MPDLDVAAPSLLSGVPHPDEMPAGLVLTRAETVEPPGTLVVALRLGTLPPCEGPNPGVQIGGGTVIEGGWYGQYDWHGVLARSGIIDPEGCHPAHEALGVAPVEGSEGGVQWRFLLPADRMPAVVRADMTPAQIADAFRTVPGSVEHHEAGEVGQALERRPIRYVGPAEFQEAGFLQEINREWLHPRGMALAVEKWAPGAPDGQPHRRDAIGIALAEVLVDGLLPTVTADQVLALVAAIEPYADLSDDRFVGIWDDRDDPEGVIFAMPATLPDGTDVRHTARARAAAVRAEYDRHVDARERLFGHPIQSVEQIVRSTDQ